MTKTISLAALLLAAPLAAQTSPYANQPERSIAALSADEVAGLLDGAGMGYALAAELNRIPGPRHVLELADSLHLDDAQRERVVDVFRRMQTEARRLGADIVERERALDAAFAASTLTAEDVERQTVDLGLLYGRLRAVHLVAHLETAAILSPHQVTRYSQLRGYRTGTGHGAHH